MPRKPPSIRGPLSTTYLDARGKMSTRPGNGQSAAPASRAAPPSKPGTIYFERGSAIPREEDLAVLRRHANYLIRNPQFKLAVEGYSNRRRPDDGARALARTRAAIVQMLLQTLGVRKRQITSSVGDVYRVTEATTRKSRARNRRAQLSAGLWDTGVSLLRSGVENFRRTPRAHRRAA